MWVETEEYTVLLSGLGGSESYIIILYLFNELHHGEFYYSKSEITFNQNDILVKGRKLFNVTFCPVKDFTSLLFVLHSSKQGSSEKDRLLYL